MAELAGRRILIVEDEPGVSDFLTKALVEEGCEVVVAGDVETGSDRWRSENPEVVVLDVMLPDGSGLDLLHTMRAEGLRTPVLILSAKGTMSERVSGLDAGADDYLSKPFGMPELIARLRVLVRRAQFNEPHIVACGDLRIDLTSQRVTCEGKVVFLSVTEYRLLDILAQRKGQVVPKKDILAYVWDDTARDGNIVEVYVNYVRSKIERGGPRRLIHTVRGRGYVLSEADDVD